MRSIHPPAARAGVLAALTAALAMVLAVLAPAPASADHTVATQRIAGATRAETAARVALTTYPEGTQTALLARADAFPDALSAAALAGVRDAPVLLTDRDTIPQPTRDALERLGVDRVVLLGGNAAISPEIEDGLGERYEVERIAGPTRYATAAAVARRVAAEAGVGAMPGGMRTVFLASGERFADALAAGAPAAWRTFPILLTEPDELPQETAAAIADTGAEQVLVVGGPAAVSPAVVDDLEARGLNVVRISGPTRVATAVEVAEFARQYLDAQLANVVLARGDAFPDALAAGPYAGALRAPVLLAASPDELGGPTGDWLQGRCPEVMAVRAIGGQAAIGDAILQRAADAAEACHADGGATTDQTYIVAPQQAQVGSPGASFELSVGARYDDRPFTGPVDITLFPCENVTATSSPIVFDDEDDDGLADAIATTDDGAARIATVNGEPSSGDTYVVGAVPGEDGVLRFTVVSDSEDCAVPVVFADAEPARQLQVDEQGHPVEWFGLTRLAWQS